MFSLQPERVPCKFLVNLWLHVHSLRIPARQINDELIALFSRCNFGGGGGGGGQLKWAGLIRASTENLPYCRLHIFESLLQR